MRYIEFADCCGLGIIYRLSENYTLDSYATVDKASFQKHLGDAEDKARNSDVTLAMIASIEEQSADKLLAEAGWKPVFNFKNRNSGNVVTVWVKNVQDGSGWAREWDAEIEFLQEKT